MARRPRSSRQHQAGQVMTVDQVATYLQLNRLTVYRYVREGKIPAAKIGKVYRILRSDVHQFLESQKVSGRQAPSRSPELPVGGGRKSVRVRDVKSPEEIFVGPNRPERRQLPEGLILTGDPLEVIIRGWN